MTSASLLSSTVSNTLSPTSNALTPTLGTSVILPTKPSSAKLSTSSITSASSLISFLAQFIPSRVDPEYHSSSIAFKLRKKDPSFSLKSIQKLAQTLHSLIYPSFINTISNSIPFFTSSSSKHNAQLLYSLTFLLSITSLIPSAYAPCAIISANSLCGPAFAGYPTAYDSEEQLNSFLKSIQDLNSLANSLSGCTASALLSPMSGDNNAPISTWRYQTSYWCSQSVQDVCISYLEF